MGRKKVGKFESDKAPKIKSSNGKSEAPKDKTKKKSQKAEEKIEAAIEVLEREKITLKELSKASVDILTASIMRPIHKKLEDIQASYETKKEELFGEIIAHSKKLDASTKAVIEKEIQGIEKFEKRMEPLYKSEDLDDSMSFRTLRMYGKTYMGSISARIARTPYTLAARYQALKGDTRKQEELLFKATGASRRVIEKLRTKNRKFARETEARVHKFNEVDDATEHYKEREALVREAEDVTKAYVKENSEKGLRRKISSKISKAGEKRIYRANWAAEKVEDIGSWVARRAAKKGHFGIADFAAKKTVEASDYIVENAALKNKKEYAKTNSIIRGHEAAKSISSDVMDEIEIDEAIAKAFANVWANKKGNSLRAKGIKLVNSAITSSTKFFAKGDMKITEVYAKAVSNLGFSEHGIKALRSAEKRVGDSMINAERVNRGIRKQSDRVFGFSEKRAKNKENAGSFMEALKKGISTGALKDSKGEFSSWIEDIEAKRAQQKVKRRFNLTGKKIGMLELLERGAQGVLSKVQGSLGDAREARAAAQMDLEMNPEEKNSKKPTREDRE